MRSTSTWPTIGAVSVALSLVGLEIGRRMGDHLGRRSEFVGGAVLILVGVAIGTGLLWRLAISRKALTRSCGTPTE
jgi:putative Mn2+ efflux pump MntP